MRRATTFAIAAATLAAGLELAAAPPAVAQEPVHVVRGGENLTLIARRYGTTVSALREVNALSNPNRILVGSRLRIPGSTHVVRPGENLSLIARRYGTSVSALRTLNALSDPNRIVAGHRLRIPGGGGGGAATTHLVQPGENLSTIARRYGVTVAVLAQTNGISDPNLVWAGRSLSVPASSGSGVQAAGAGPMRPVAVPASRAHLRGVFERYAAEYGVPADLVMALAWQESGWQQDVVSSTGAIGVMQLMPATVDFVSQVLLRRRSNLDPHDAEQNIRMGTRQLRYLIDQTDGDLHLALAAYYQGLGAVRRHGPYAESRRFSANVLALRSRF